MKYEPNDQKKTGNEQGKLSLMTTACAAPGSRGKDLGSKRNHSAAGFISL